MPSELLTKISKEIDEKGPDSFSKFYMYAAVLNKITVRDSQDFDDLLPKDERKLLSVFNPYKTPKTPSLTSDFYSNIGKYSLQYAAPPREEKGLMILNLVLAYFRRGNLADLVEIVEKMHGHLKATKQVDKLSRENQILCSSIGFNEALKFSEALRPHITQYLDMVATLNVYSVDAVDNGGRLAIALMTTTIAAVTVLVITGSLLAAGLIAISGAALAYLFFSRMQRAYVEFRKTAVACSQLAKAIKIPAEGVTDEGKVAKFFTEDPLAKSFIVDTIIRPCAFYNITVQEQIGIFGLREKTDGHFIPVTNEEMREELDCDFNVNRKIKF